MTINAILQARADAKCELCGAEHALTAFPVPHSPASDDDHSVALCTTCRGQLEQPDTTEVNHWRCLGDSMWSQVPAVQVMAWRQLKNLSARGEIWAQDMLDMMYMEEETKAWAEALEKKLVDLEFRRMFSGQHDPSDCYMDIQSGSGGTEAQDWASMVPMGNAVQYW